MGERDLVQGCEEISLVSQRDGDTGHVGVLVKGITIYRKLLKPQF
jgi:hypothetical protein